MNFLGSITLSALSPSWISLCPPEPLVIQVEVGGEYAGIQWTRTPIALNVSSDEMVDFQQTFVRTVTSEEDWGLYYVSLLTTNSISNVTVTITVTCNFTVFGKGLVLGPMIWDIINSFVTRYYKINVGTVAVACVGAHFLCVAIGIM